MTVTAAYFLSLSESYMKEMLKDCQVWRAMVQSPDTDWETLQTLIDAETADETEAANRILYGRLIKEARYHAAAELPNVVIRHFDGNSGLKHSTSGWEMAGLIYLGFAFPIPEIYQDDPNDAYFDALNKLGGLIQNLCALPLRNPYLHLTQIEITAFGEEDPANRNAEEEPYYVAELAIHHRGSIL